MIKCILVGIGGTPFTDVAIQRGGPEGVPGGAVPAGNIVSVGIAACVRKVAANVHICPGHRDGTDVTV